MMVFNINCKTCNHIIKSYDLDDDGLFRMSYYCTAHGFYIDTFKNCDCCDYEKRPNYF